MLVDLGIDPYTIDKAIQFGFGMPMGPFRCVTWPSGCCPCRTHTGSCIKAVALATPLGISRLAAVST